MFRGEWSLFDPMGSPVTGRFAESEFGIEQIELAVHAFGISGPSRVGVGN